MSGALTIVVLTVALIALSAFFVAVEFALLGAKRHRLQDAAASSRSARAALCSADELTVLLAGCQLGITVCALALGAVTKPAVHHGLVPAFETWGAAPWAADVVAFGLALLVVTFLHLVVGEMAPKSWAIAHPESSATLLAVPMRAFMWLTRPALVALNSAANWCLRRVGVAPREAIPTGRTPEDLRQLVEHSAGTGALSAEYFAQLAVALDLRSLTVRDLVGAKGDLTAVPVGADVGVVRRTSRASGHLRILLCEGPEVVGVVHVRDTMTMPVDAPVAPVGRPVFALDAAVPVYSALASMRERRTHLALVRDGDEQLGVLALGDILDRLFPSPPATTGARTS